MFCSQNSVQRFKGHFRCPDFLTELPDCDWSSAGNEPITTREVWAPNVPSTTVENHVLGYTFRISTTLVLPASMFAVCMPLTFADPKPPPGDPANRENDIRFNWKNTAWVICISSYRKSTIRSYWKVDYSTFTNKSTIQKFDKVDRLWDDIESVFLCL